MLTPVGSRPLSAPSLTVEFVSPTRSGGGRLPSAVLTLDNRS